MALHAMSGPSRYGKHSSSETESMPRIPAGSRDHRRQSRLKDQLSALFPKMGIVKINLKNVACFQRQFNGV
jgi:hypothetical protein